VLRALYELGQYMEENEDISKFESLLSLDRLSDREKVIAIKFIISEEKVEYDGIQIEDYEENKGRQMLYMYGSSRGGDNSPTSQLTRLHETIEEKESEDTKNDTLQRIWDYGWFKKYGDSSDLTKKIEKEYRDKESKIRKDIFEKYDNLETDEKRNTVLTIKLNKDGEDHFIDDFEVFKKELKKIAINDWKNKYKSTSQGKGKCVLCQEEKKVYGFSFPFPFYNLDKRGFAPFFDTSKSHQRLPICEECSFYLQLGKNFLDKNSFHFNIPFEDRLNYYVILEFLFDSQSEGTYSDILPRIENAKFKDEVDFPLISLEDYITSVVMEESSSAVNLHYLFYTKPKQSQQRIEEFVTDVPPSYLKEIKEEIKKIEHGWILGLDNKEKINLENYNIRIKDNENMQDRGYLESIILKILPDRDEVSDLSQTGLEYATKILKREEMSYDSLINMFLKEMRRRFRQEEYETHYALNSFLFLNLLYKLDLVGGKKMEEDVNFWETDIKPIDEFFDEYGTAFDTSEKRAAFLQGVVTKLFLGIQASQRGSTPFRKKLGGMRLDERKLSRIYSDLENKFAQYDKEYAYQDLRETTSQYLLEAEESGWDVSNDVISYYFSLGLNLGKMFKPENKEGGKNE